MVELEVTGYETDRQFLSIGVPRRSQGFAA